MTADLLARGFEVRAIVRPESAHEAPAGAVPVRAPLDAAALREAFAGADAVVHLAGVVSALQPSVYSTVNVEGTRAVARAAARRWRATGPRLEPRRGRAGPGRVTAPRGRSAEPADAVRPQQAERRAGGDGDAGPALDDPAAGRGLRTGRPGAVAAVQARRAGPAAARRTRGRRLHLRARPRCRPDDRRGNRGGRRRRGPVRRASPAGQRRGRSSRRFGWRSAARRW